MTGTIALTGGAKRAYDHLTSMIGGDRLQPGDRLPTERSLAEELGCSRTEIRRALSQLEIDGVVVRHVGRGTFVSPLESRSPGARLSHSPTDLMSARLLLEPSIMSVAALTATEEDYQEMQRCLRGGDSTDAYEEFEAWDMALHRSFAVATHNNVLVAMVDILHSSRHDPMWGGLKRRSFSGASCINYRKEHHDIVAALRDRDPKAAALAMTRHLQSVRSAILG